MAKIFWLTEGPRHLIWLGPGLKFTHLTTALIDNLLSHAKAISKVSLKQIFISLQNTHSNQVIQNYLKHHFIISKICFSFCAIRQWRLRHDFSFLWNWKIFAFSTQSTPVDFLSEKTAASMGFFFYNWWLKQIVSSNCSPCCHYYLPM